VRLNDLQRDFNDTLAITEAARKLCYFKQKKNSGIDEELHPRRPVLNFDLGLVTGDY
jgi:hypothetical protein